MNKSFDFTYKCWCGIPTTQKQKSTTCLCIVGVFVEKIGYSIDKQTILFHIQSADAGFQPLCHPLNPRPPNRTNCGLQYVAWGQTLIWHTGRPATLTPGHCHSCFARILSSPRSYTRWLKQAAIVDVPVKLWLLGLHNVRGPSRLMALLFVTMFDYLMEKPILLT